VLPLNGKTTVDFNKAYNPRARSNDFATCPLPRHRIACGCESKRARRRFGRARLVSLIRLLKVACGVFSPPSKGVAFAGYAGALRAFATCESGWPKRRCSR